MEPDERVFSYVNRFSQLLATLKSIYVTRRKEMDMAELSGHSDRFDTVRVARDALGNEDITFTLEFVKKRLLHEDDHTTMR